MSICQNCEVRAERPCTWASRTREYYDVLMPALRYVAYRAGYAIAVHGSLKTDIDLIAVPWRDSAVGAEYMAEKIRKTAEQIIGIARVRDGEVQPVKKECGRLAWSFYLTSEDWPGPYIDLSVMPIPPMPVEQPEPSELARRMSIDGPVYVDENGEPLPAQPLTFAVLEEIPEVETFPEDCLKLDPDPPSQDFPF